MKLHSISSRMKSALMVLTIAVATLMTLSISLALAASTTPALPEEFKKDANGKMVLLDFYSAYCGTCRMMEPYLKSLEARTKSNIQFERIDLTNSDNDRYMNLYTIEGTPTYILYNQQGKPLYRMQEFITPVVLEKQIMRLTGQLKKMNLPADINVPNAHPIAAGQVGKDELNEMLLIAFEKSDCQACREMTPYLQGFEMTGQQGLHIVHLDIATPAGKKLMDELSIQSLPTYVLFDNNANSIDKTGARGELFRMSGQVRPRLLWDVIRMFGDAGV
jgi:thiol:disulfide interchange protein